jgi:transposase-like protein
VRARRLGPCAREERQRRGAPGELVALGERFNIVLCQRPGETMTTLAPQVGVAPRVLQVAVTRLRRDGRVRVIGKKQQTRYYPMATTPSATTTTAVAA